MSDIASDIAPLPDEPRETPEVIALRGMAFVLRGFVGRLQPTHPKAAALIDEAVKEIGNV